MKVERRRKKSQSQYNAWTKIYLFTLLKYQPFTDLLYCEDCLSAADIYSWWRSPGSTGRSSLCWSDTSGRSSLCGAWSCWIRMWTHETVEAPLYYLPLRITINHSFLLILLLVDVPMYKITFHKHVDNWTHSLAFNEFS